MARMPGRLSRRRSGRAAPLAALLLPASVAGNAGGGALPADPPLESVIVTATRIEQSVFDAAAAISTVDAEELRRQAPKVLAEMMRGLPGTFFQQTTPGQGIPIIRGLKGSQVLHLVDGMRLNNALFRDAPNQYLGLVDGYASERTEVIRGAAPSVHGADAMGGVVQVLSQEPSMEGTSWTARGSIYGAYASADSSLVGRAEAVAGHSGSVLSGGVTYQDYRDRETGGGNTVRPSAYRVRAADVKFRHDFSGHSELMLSAQYLEQPSTPRVDELVPGFGQTEPSAARYEFRPNRREFLHARYRFEGQSRWFSRAEAHLARQVITDDRLTREFGEAQTLTEFNSSELDGVTLQFNSPWGRDGDDRELVWGFEYYADTISSHRLSSIANTEPGRPVAPRFPDGSTMNSMAVYLSNHWSWDRLTLDAGVRYSRFETRLPASPEIGEVHLTPTDLTGDLHLSYELAPGAHLVSNLGRGFRPPNIFDLGTLGSRPGNRFNVPNPQLQPESVLSYDLGVKVSRGRWQGEAFAWYADYRDKISSRFTGELTPEGRRVVRSDNLNAAELYGFESGLRLQAGAGLELYAVVNYVHGQEKEPDGTTVPGDRIPPLNGRLGLTWAVNGLHFEPYIDFASSQDRLSPRDAEDPRINPEGTPGWATLNLLLSWRSSRDVSVGLSLRNIGDKSYREHGSGIDAPGRDLGAWMSFAF
jgi:outer membrane receptor protein involved in Fe transport